MDTSRDQLLERPLPNSAESERAILGAIILDNGLIAQAVELLVQEDFYVPAHRRIFDAMLKLFEKGSEINPVLIGEELKRDGSLESVGGLTFISNLTFGLPHFANIANYAKVVRDKSQARQLIRACSKSVSEALEEEEDVEVLCDRAESMIFAVRDRRSTESAVRINALADLRIEAAQTRQHSDRRTTGISTGYTELDYLTSGLQNSDLIIIAARPSMGKSALGLSLCHNAATEGAISAYFSLEMSKEQLTDRLLCSAARIDAQRFRLGHLSRDEWSRLAQARGELESLPLFIDDTPGLSVMQLRAKARRIAAAQKGLNLVVVDYLNLMRGQKVEAGYQEATQLVKELKSVAKELNVPLVLLAQLNRACEQRADKRPLLSDLRESGAIEENADIVAFIFREEYYNRTEVNAGIAEVILAKQRTGPTGTIKLTFIREFTRFENMWNDDRPSRSYVLPEPEEFRH